MNIKKFKQGQLLDLLYPQNRFVRVNECRRIYYRSKEALPKILHRVTMFLTFNCNLRCFYCNTIKPVFGTSWPAKGDTYDIKQFVKFIDPLAAQNIQHLHLTGGEVTLVKDLSEMIRYATTLNIPCSITTNGTAPVQVYRKLVDSGLQEIRISLDTVDAMQFDKNVGRKGAFKKVIEAISGLVRMRDCENKNIYLILNVCVSRYDFMTLPETIQELIRLGSNDIKLIGISHDRDVIKDYNETLNIVHKIEKQIDKHSERSYPLLRKKFKTIFSQDTYGIEDFASKSLMNSCFVPLTEKTVDAKYYYPCPVYLREGGEPLGKLHEDNLKTQQKKTVDFIKGNYCIHDPICQKSCIYCTKVFNNHMNASIYKKVRRVSGNVEPITQETRYEKEISLDTIVETMGRVDFERSQYDRNITFQPFLVIKPNGMKYKRAIFSFLKKRDVVIHATKKIVDWNETALKLYTYPATMWNIYRGVLFSKVLPQIEGFSEAQILILQEDFSCEDLRKIKLEIRDSLPPENYIIHHQDEVFITSPGHLHSPDKENFWIECNVLFVEQSARQR